MSIDGVDKPSMTLCHKCRQKEQERERYEELLAVLPERMENQRWNWEEQCNVPSMFCDKTFENFDRKLQPKAFDAAKNYMCQCDEDLETPPQSMLLLSPNLYGVGKTHLVCAIINREIATREPAYLSRSPRPCISTRPCPAYFTTEASILLRIRETYNNEEGETEGDIYRKMTTDSLLVIDDVGKVRPKDYGFLQGVYYRIIDSRYVNQQPTILTTNLDYTELEEHIGGACADRLVEMCGKNIIRMSGKSHRRVSRDGKSK